MFVVYTCRLEKFTRNQVVLYCSVKIIQAKHEMTDIINPLKFLQSRMLSNET